MGMNEQRRRARAARGSEGLATMATALLLATVLALGVELLAQAVGVLAGRAGLHRGWADALLLGQALPGDAWLRDLLALAALLLPPCVLPARHLGPTLVARYDTAALRVAPVQALVPQDAPANEAQRLAWAGLAHWCRHGAGPGCAPLWRPAAQAEVELRLSVALLTGAGAPQRSSLAAAFSRDIDGSLRLQALGRLQGLRWRLRLKLDECRWWQPRADDAPWDAGYLPLSEAELQALQSFRPRRPTLIVADGLHPRLLAQALRMLQGRCAAFNHPVRLLVLAPSPQDLPPLQSAAPQSLAARSEPLARQGSVPVFDLQIA